MARAKADEQVKANLIDEKKLVTIMKRFLGSKEADPDVTKYYRVENGLNYMATTFGSAVQIFFENKYEGTFTKGTGKNFFRKPLPKEVYEDVDFIPEMETITEGKKKIKKPTGRILEYPDVAGMFKKFDLDEFCKIEIPADDIDNFIAVHEAMEKAAKIGGIYNTAELEVTRTEFKFSLYDSPLEFKWNYWIEGGIDSHYEMTYSYDFSLMTSVFKSLKDLKVDVVHMYINGKNNPIIFSGRSSEYNYHFAIQRKLVG